MLKQCVEEYQQEIHTFLLIPYTVFSDARHLMLLRIRHRLFSQHSSTHQNNISSIIITTTVTSSGVCMVRLMYSAGLN